MSSAAANANKVRIYDLAKEIRQDTKRIIEEARREGVDVSVPSNSIPLTVAEKIRNKYVPKKEPVAPRAIKVVKAVRPAHAHEEETPSVTTIEPTPVNAPTAPIVAAPASAPGVAAQPLQRKVLKLGPAARAVAPEVSKPQPAPQAVEPQPASVPVQETPAAEPVAPPEIVEAKAETPTAPQPAPSAPAVTQAPPTTVVREIRMPQPVAPQLAPAQAQTPAPAATVAARPSAPGSQIRQLRLTREALEAGLKHGERAPTVPDPTPAPSGRLAEEKRDKKKGRDKRSGRGGRDLPSNELVGTPGETATPRTTYIPPPDSRRPGRGGRRVAKGGKEARFDDRGRFGPRDYVAPGRALSLEERIVGQMGGSVKELKEARLVEGSTVKDFAEKLGIKPKEVVALLLQRGVFATINQPLNTEVATDLAKRFGYQVTFVPFEEMVAEEEFDELIATDADDVELTRAPVVTVMGHVDHGKTSLLDAIRSANVAAGEAGGITQHIGAYSVHVSTPDNPEEKRRVVFLDTPGHEAFTMMRARGAKATDVVILVVAADDGVMPQTIEAIEHARAAKVPIIVAINKVDKPEANPEKVKQELTGHGLTPIEWGGETEMVPVSAKKRENLNTLLETVLLTADLLELKASPTRLSSGVVLEAKLDRGRGSVATVLVQQGTLRVQDPFIVGQIFGKVRALYNDRGETISEAGPATPVEVLGLQGVPHAGDAFQVVSDITRAQQTAHHRQMLARQTALAQSTKRGIEMLGQADTKELLVIIKADVQGSVEVLRSTLEKLSTEKVNVKVVRSGVGAITESDVLLASATQNDSSGSAVVIIGFNARPEVRAGEVAKQENVEIRLHSVIYKVEEEIRAAMVGLLDAIEQEKIIGKALVRETFRVPRAGVIAGCTVREGNIKRTASARLIRDGIVVWEGNISSLRRFKEDVQDVREGFECGIGLENFNDIKNDDYIEAYIIEKVAATEL
jgi:translation initiation factor IF-2